MRSIIRAGAWASLALGLAACSPFAVAHMLAHPPGGRIVASTPVPILTYHVIEAATPGAAYPELYVAPSLFRQQVRALAAHGYHAVTLQDVWDAWHGIAVLPRLPVVLSFDDGYRSQLTVAARVLRRRHWPGVLNLVVAALHDGTYGLGPREVREMLAMGWEVDSHTLTHPDLTGLDDATLRREVAGSRRILRRTFGIPVSFFCYPSGAFDARVIAAVRRAGYLGATTTIPGLAAPGDGRFTLHRIRVSAGESPAALLASLHP